jgi:hypothetical protein
MLLFPSFSTAVPVGYYFSVLVSRQMPDSVLSSRMTSDAALFYRRPQSAPATLDFHPSPCPFSLRPAQRSKIPAFDPLCALLQKSERHPFYLQSLAHSLQKHRGCHQERFFNSSNLNSSILLPVTPLDATLAADLRVLTEISRNSPPATPLDATLTDFAPVTPLSATLTKTRGRGCQC